MRNQKRLDWLTPEWKDQTKKEMMKIKSQQSFLVVKAASHFQIPYSTFSSVGYSHFYKTQGRLRIKGKNLKKLLSIFLKHPCKVPRIPKLGHVVKNQQNKKAPRNINSSLLETFNQLTGILDGLSKDDARNLAFHLAEQYSRSTQDNRNEKEMATEVEKSQT